VKRRIEIRRENGRPVYWQWGRDPHLFDPRPLGSTPARANADDVVVFRSRKALRAWLANRIALADAAWDEHGMNFPKPEPRLVALAVRPKWLDRLRPLVEQACAKAPIRGEHYWFTDL